MGPASKRKREVHNIMIIGPANCAKTFLLSPLRKIFNTFSNPANDKYSWLEAKTLRWKSEMIAWKELLLLLAGQTVHLRSPKNPYSSDICIDSDVPIVANKNLR